MKQTERRSLEAVLDPQPFFQNFRPQAETVVPELESVSMLFR
jgi:hypothetical protein